MIRSIMMMMMMMMMMKMSFSCILGVMGWTWGVSVCMQSPLKGGMLQFVMVILELSQLLNLSELCNLLLYVAPLRY